eukprot:TRINITY_DN28531_c0_g3_i2.p1 TRINITY_DN28531_c0_g3~~TRINITY_DN28531_c0_g3_i2.p1  ORF type:complete len:360 (+),score=91.95 TRINITY_DN28531_c0_g3_i2:102-1082(+)
MEDELAVLVVMSVALFVVAIIALYLFLRQGDELRALKNILDRYADDNSGLRAEVARLVAARADAELASEFGSPRLRTGSVAKQVSQLELGGPGEPAAPALPLRDHGAEVPLLAMPRARSRRGTPAGDGVDNAAQEGQLGRAAGAAEQHAQLRPVRKELARRLLELLLPRAGADLRLRRSHFTALQLRALAQRAPRQLVAPRPHPSSRLAAAPPAPRLTPQEARDSAAAAAATALRGPARAPPQLSRRELSPDALCPIWAPPASATPPLTRTLMLPTQMQQLGHCASGSASPGYDGQAYPASHPGRAAGGWRETLLSVASGGARATR